MNNTELEKIISDTQSNPYIKWNNSSLADWCRVDGEFSVYLFNRDGNHGYFSLLHNLTSNVEGLLRVVIATFFFIDSLNACGVESYGMVSFFGAIASTKLFSEGSIFG